MERLSPALIRKAQSTSLPFASLPAIATLREQLDELEGEAVAFARANGATWSDIAQALGITRQALQQRVARRELARARSGPSPSAPVSGRVQV